MPDRNSSTIIHDYVQFTLVGYRHLLAAIENGTATEADYWPCRNPPSVGEWCSAFPQKLEGK